MGLLSKILAVHRANFDPGDEDETVIGEILFAYNLEQEANVPEWFMKLLDGLLAGEPLTFEFESVGSEIGSVLAELQEDLDWQVDDYGEGIVINFFKMGLQAVISREHTMSTGGSGCSCSISNQCWNHAIRPDYLVYEAYGGWDPADDPLAALKFCFNAILRDGDLDWLIDLLQTSRDLQLQGDPGWELERRAGSSPISEWPVDKPFRASVPVGLMGIEHDEIYVDDKTFQHVLSVMLDAYDSRFRANQESLMALRRLMTQKS